MTCRNSFSGRQVIPTKRTLPARLHLAQRRDRLGDDLLDVAELHVVDLDEIDVVHAQAGEAFVDAARHTFAAEKSKASSL